MIMLPKVKNGSSWLRFGVVALTIPITLSIPVTASAAVPGAASAQIKATYVNRAKATSNQHRRTDYSAKFRLRQSSASIINADESAVAQSRKCHGCTAVAIAFQVIFVPAQNLIGLNQDTTAVATNYDCVNCSTLAEAYQIAYISTSQKRLTYHQLAGLHRVGAQLEALQHSRLSTDQIQNKVAGLVNQAVSILTNGAVPAPADPAPAPTPAASASPVTLAVSASPVSPAVSASPVSPAVSASPVSPAVSASPVSPAVNASSLPAQLTQLNQPVIDIFSKIDSA
jgi:hypothetical protein